MKHKTEILTAGISAILVGGIFIAYKFLPKMKLKKYTEACLYIAVLDDEICRNELEGNSIGDKKIVFPPKRESVNYRYKLFLNMYKKYSSKEIEEEIIKYEKRLAESRQCKNQPKVNLKVEFE